jgi:MFS transporter, DHA2 family, multidrug resistance protein
LIEEMILWRGVQGVLRGSMIPSVFAAFAIFPAFQRSVVSPLAGLLATLAPTVDPTLGGYLSSHLSWHRLVLVNVPASPTWPAPGR